MAELEALQQLIQQQALAQGESKGLEQQRANAMALRNSPAQQAGRSSGYASPLGNIAQVLNSYSGNKMQAQVEPQIAAGQQAIAEGQAARDNYGLQKAADQYQTQQDAKTAALKLSASKYRTSQEEKQAALDVAAAQGKRVDRVNPETGQPESIMQLPNGTLIRNGVALENPSEWPEYQKPTARSGAGKNPLAWTPKRREKFEEDAVQANTVTGMISSFAPEFASPSNVPLTGSTSNFLATNVGPLSTEAMKERQAWWSDYKSNYELITRHGLFGSALTKNESNEWKKASINADMTPEQISTNLKKMQEIINRKAAKQAGNASMAGLPNNYIEHNLAGLTPEEFRAEKEAEAADLEEEVEQPPEDVPLVNSQGWQLLVDGQGNRAYVGPNGEVEEVQ